MRVSSAILAAALSVAAIFGTASLAIADEWDIGDSNYYQLKDYSALKQVLIPDPSRACPKGWVGRWPNCEFRKTYNKLSQIRFKNFSALDQVKIPKVKNARKLQCPPGTRPAGRNGCVDLPD